MAVMNTSKTVKEDFINNMGMVPLRLINAATKEVLFQNIRPGTRKSVSQSVSSSLLYCSGASDLYRPLKQTKKKDDKDQIVEWQQGMQEEIESLRAL